jgi:glycine cleavage system H protein
MTTLTTVLETLAVLVSGLLIRVAVALVFALAFAVPILLLVKVWELVKARVGAQPDPEWAGDLRFRPDALYAPGHAWLAATWRDLRVGLDDLARRIVGVPEAVTLPAPGARLRAGEPAVILRRGPRVAVLPAPVAGTVTAANDALLRQPALLAREPYGRGWLYRIRPDLGRAPALPTGEEAHVWLRSEAARFEHALERELGYAAADGGHPPLPAEAALDDRQWRRIAEEFLALAA